MGSNTLYKKYLNLLKSEKIHIKTYRPNSMTGTQAHRFVSKFEKIIELFKKDKKYNCHQFVDDNSTIDGNMEYDSVQIYVKSRRTSI